MIILVIKNFYIEHNSGKLNDALNYFLDHFKYKIDDDFDLLIMQFKEEGQEIIYSEKLHKKVRLNK